MTGATTRRIESARGQTVRASDVRGETVYLDHAATTPLRDVAREAMEPFLDGCFANPSGSHRLAREARRAVDEARDTVAEVIGCRPGEVVFTSGGTEGANAAILGSVRRHGGRAVCPATEHHAVLHCVEHVGGSVVEVERSAAVSVGALEERLTRDPNGLADLERVSVVSVMAVNNEVGTISDLAAVRAVVGRRAPGALLHTDAVQAACWLDLRGLWTHVDAMSLSAHKFGGPKGVGVLVIRTNREIEPLILGGGQERDRRSGTHNVAGIVGMAAALRMTDTERSAVVTETAVLRARLVEGILSAVPEARCTVPDAPTVPGIAHVCLRGMENEALLYLLDEAGICASAASACASGAIETSHVLAAMGVGEDLSRGSLRFSLGHGTRVEDVDRAVAATVAAAERVRTAGAHRRGTEPR